LYLKVFLNNETNTPLQCPIKKQIMACLDLLFFMQSFFPLLALRYKWNMRLDYLHLPAFLTQIHLTNHNLHWQLRQKIHVIVTSDPNSLNWQWYWQIWRHSPTYGMPYQLMTSRTLTSVPSSCSLQVQIILEHQYIPNHVMYIIQFAGVYSHAIDAYGQKLDTYTKHYKLNFTVIIHNTIHLMLAFGASLKQLCTKHVNIISFNGIQLLIHKKQHNAFLYLSTTNCTHCIIYPLTFKCHENL